MLKVLDVLFGCTHHHLTFPRTVKAPGRRTSGTYVVCLDCGKEFAYDWAQMKVIFSPDGSLEPVAEPAPAGSQAA